MRHDDRAVRRAIQNSQESLRALANRYGINQKTVAKWKKSFVGDRSADRPERAAVDGSVGRGRGSRRRIPPAYPAAARRLSVCPAGDHPASDALLAASLPATPRDQPVAGRRRRQARQEKFKAYPIGFFHIDIAEVQTAEGKLYLFVAIDRTSNSPSLELGDAATVHSASTFLDALIAAVPYKIHTVLTDNGTLQFAATQPPRRNGPTARIAHDAYVRHATCREHDIEHRLTKPNHPWTTDVIDKCFFAGSELFSSRARATAWRRAGREAQALPRSLHRRPSVAAPVRACLGPRGFQPATKRAYAVSACSTHLRS